MSAELAAAQAGALTDVSESSAAPSAARIITPSLYEVTIQHVRSTPLKHAFTYGGYQWLVDLDALPQLPRGLRSLASFRASDHLGSSDRSIRQNVDHFLGLNGIDLGGGRIVMLAHARVLGYVFNPFTAYWCFRSTGELACVIAEVHNTYGDRHAYIIETDARGRGQVDKEFYVSPFNPVDGKYTMSLPVPDERLDLVITLHRPDQAPFVASMKGPRTNATTSAVVRTFLKHPVAPLAATLRIRRHGITLWLRGLRPVKRPSHHQEGVQ